MRLESWRKHPILSSVGNVGGMYFWKDTDRVDRPRVRLFVISIGCHLIWLCCPLEDVPMFQAVPWVWENTRQSVAIVRL